MFRAQVAMSRLKSLSAMTLFCLAAGGLQGVQASPQLHHGVKLEVSSVHRVHGYKVHGGMHRPHVFHRHHGHRHVYHHHHPYRHGHGLALGLGVLGGGLVGAAIAHSATPVVVNPPVVYTQPAVIASSVPVQSAALDPAQPVSPPYGTVYSALPAGCQLEQVLGQNYYRCGSYWYLPQFGPQGVQYQYVAPPR